FMCILFGDTGHLEHNASGFNHSNPEFRVSFSGAHTSFSGLLAHRLVWKDADPQLPTTLNAARHRFTSRFDLARGNPGWLEHLQAVLAELNIDSTRFATVHATTLVFSKFRALWHEHG